MDIFCYKDIKAIMDHGSLMPLVAFAVNNNLVSKLATVRIFVVI